MSSTGASPKTNIMSNEQVGNIRRGALAWLTPKTHEKCLQFLQAVKFELVTDKECWLRGNGKITVRMVIKFNQQSYNGPDKEVKVYSSNNAFYDLKGIAVQLASILSEYLQSINHVALIHFTGETKEAMMEGWQPQAAQWLIDDIRDDADIFKYFTYRSEEGRKIIIESPFGQDLFESYISFQENECWFAILIDQLSEDIDKHYGVANLLTQSQKSAAAKAMAPTIVEAVRHKEYCFPYSQDTKNKLLDMTEYIKQASGQIGGVSTLALAGAMADALDDDLEDKVPQAYDLWVQGAAEYIKRNFNNINDIISALLSLAIESPDPRIQSAGATLTIAWNVIMGPLRAKEFLVFVTKIFVELGFFPGELLDRLRASIRDERHDNLVMLEVTTLINPKTISKADATKLRAKFKDLIAKTASPIQMLCYYAFSESQYRGKIIHNAKKIDRLISGRNKKPEDRHSVTMWERFYHYF